MIRKAKKLVYDRIIVLPILLHKIVQENNSYKLSQFYIPIPTLMRFAVSAISMIIGIFVTSGEIKQKIIISSHKRF